MNYLYCICLFHMEDRVARGMGGGGGGQGSSTLKVGKPYVIESTSACISPSERASPRR